VTSKHVAVLEREIAELESTLHAAGQNDNRNTGERNDTIGVSLNKSFDYSVLLHSPTTWAIIVRRPPTKKEARSPATVNGSR